MFIPDISRPMDDLENGQPKQAGIVLLELYVDLLRLEVCIRNVAGKIKDIANRDETARRLMTILVVGLLSPTAILAFLGIPSCLTQARVIAAWLGMVPRAQSTRCKRPCSAKRNKQVAISEPL